MEERKKFYTVHVDTLVTEAIKFFREGAPRLYLVDDKGSLKGVLSRRDLRFLTFDEINNKKVSEYSSNDHIVAAPEGTSKEKLIKILKQYKTNSIPIVSKTGKILDVVSYEEIKTQVFSCFVILPFKEPYLYNFENHIKAPLEDRLPVIVRKVDDIFRAEPIIDTIQYLISIADVLIADVSEKNPNVYYEVGYAHALKKKIIFIAQNKNNMPFDIAHWRCITYQSTPPGLKKLESELYRALKATLAMEKKSLDNLLIDKIG